MTSPSLARRIGALLLSVALLALSGGMAWAAAADYANKQVAANGVYVGSTDVGGMDAEQISAVIGREISAPLLAPVTVEADDEVLSFAPKQAVRIDERAMLGQALGARGRAPFAERLAHDLLGRDLDVKVEARYEVDEGAVRQWVADLADEMDRKPQNATVAVEDGKIVITPAVEGRTLVRDDAERTIESALRASGVRTATLDVKKKQPKVTEKKFRKAIVVDLSKRRIRLYKNGELEKTYPCAIGTPSFPTPKGEFEVTLKRYRPTWVNPGSDWAKEMPPFIPPGPENPLGTRAINLSAPGIRFHGTNNIRSVGTAASHGCMRMYRADIEDLYERVYVGTKVFIVP